MAVMHALTARPGPSPPDDRDPARRQKNTASPRGNAVQAALRTWAGTGRRGASKTAFPRRAWERVRPPSSALRPGIPPVFLATESNFPPNEESIRRAGARNRLPQGRCRPFGYKPWLSPVSAINLAIRISAYDRPEESIDCADHAGNTGENA